MAIETFNHAPPYGSTVVTPLILIPGMMCDARLFAPQIAAFSARRPVHIANITGKPTISDLATHVLETAPPRFALAGLSMGGIVAMEIMVKAPSRVDRLCLMDTNALDEPEKYAAMREPQIERAREGALAAVMRDEMKPNYLAATKHRQDILDLCMEMAMSLGPAVFERQSRALQSRPNQIETLRSVQVPTLVLMGREDRLCPLKRHEQIAQAVGHARLEIIENAGHLPTLEAPDVTTYALETWLSA